MRVSTTAGILGSLLIAACSSDGTRDDLSGGTTAGTVANGNSATSTGGIGTAANTGAINNTGAGAGTATTTNGTATSTGTAGVLADGGSASTTGASNSGSSTGAVAGGPTDLPTPSGTCPEFTSGSVTFSPAGITARSVSLNVGASGGGPLVFYWHGTGSSPSEAGFGLGSSVVSEITGQGGVVAAPTADSAAGTYPWFLVSGNREDDLILADEIVACAIEKKQIDTTHIHSLGMSAGGLHTSQMGPRRSSYVGSIVVYSGGVNSGFGGPTFEDPSNKFAAMLFFGGADDQFGGIVNFKDTTAAYDTLLSGAGHFTMLCDHGGGHSIANGSGAHAWRFFQDHPYGTDPSPYEASGLPSTFPSYCTE